MLTVASDKEVKGFYNPDSAQHLSLAKKPDMTWAGLGPWAVKGGGGATHVIVYQTRMVLRDNISIHNMTNFVIA